MVLHQLHASMLIIISSVCPGTPTLDTRPLLPLSHLALQLYLFLQCAAITAHLRCCWPLVCLRVCTLAHTHSSMSDSIKTGRIKLHSPGNGLHFALERVTVNYHSSS
ncbi:hypothetical protein H4582DRAFT_1554067 [Lactarius indigo]|nr:hypothetical protein H4582DRAFT_1554067 [Lactarius indigo]